MKRLLTLIALLGLLGVFAGCNQSGSDTSASTNAPPAAASTNK